MCCSTRLLSNLDREKKLLTRLSQPENYENQALSSDNGKILIKTIQEKSLVVMQQKFGFIFFKFYIMVIASSNTEVYSLITGDQKTDEIKIK